MPANTSEDYRSDPRVPVRCTVEVPLANPEQLRRLRARNLSRGGIMFTIDAPATLPGVIEFRLRLPDGRAILLYGEVRHVEPSGTSQINVGVQFKGLDDALRKQLEAALASSCDGFAPDHH